MVLRTSSPSRRSSQSEYGATVAAVATFLALATGGADHPQIEQGVGDGSANDRLVVAGRGCGGPVRGCARLLSQPVRSPQRRSGRHRRSDAGIQRRAGRWRPRRHQRNLVRRQHPRPADDPRRWRERGCAEAGAVRLAEERSDANGCPQCAASELPAYHRPAHCAASIGCQRGDPEAGAVPVHQPQVVAGSGPGGPPAELPEADPGHHQPAQDHR